MQNVKRTSMDYLKTMHSIFDKDYKDVVSKHEHCQFKGKEGERYCLATTQNSCYRCRHFSPTTQSQLRIVVEKTEELKGKIKSRDMTIAHLKDEIARYKEIIEQKDIRIEELAEKLDDATDERVELMERIYELQSESDNESESFEAEEGDRDHRN